MHAAKRVLVHPIDLITESERVDLDAIKALIIKTLTHNTQRYTYRLKPRSVLLYAEAFPGYNDSGNISYCFPWRL